MITLRVHLQVSLLVCFVLYEDSFAIKSERCNAFTDYNALIQSHHQNNNRNEDPRHGFPSRHVRHEVGLAHE